MPGLPIKFRAISVGCSQPTVIYKCVEATNGEWNLVKEFELDNYASIEDLSHLIQDHLVAPHKPVFVEDAHPRAKYEFRRKGLRIM